MTFSLILIEVTNNSYRYDNGEGVFGRKFHYPYELSIVKHTLLHLSKEYIKTVALFPLDTHRLLLKNRQKLWKL